MNASNSPASATRAPKVSCIIPTYNRAALVTAAVECVLHQTFADYELIVVDDGSTDDTRRRLQPYMERIRYHYQPNRGVSAARNAGLRLARGEWISMLDSDDAWHPTKLERQLHALAILGPAYGACFTDCSYRGNHPEFNSTVFEASGLKTDAEFAPLPNPLRYMVDHKYAICVQSLIVLRSLMDEIGGFDEDLGLAEDRDLVFKLSFKTAFCFVTAPLVAIDRRPDIPRLTDLCTIRNRQTYAWGELLLRKMLGRAELVDPELQSMFQKELMHLYYSWAAASVNDLRPAQTLANIRKLHGMGQSYCTIGLNLLLRAGKKLVRSLRLAKQQA